MVVVSGRAATVRRLTVAGSDGVEIACVAHQLQGSVDRGQADAFAVMSKIVVDLLSCSEVMAIGQYLLNSGPLPSLALSTRRLDRRRCCGDRLGRHLGAPRRLRPGCSVLIVVIGMGSVPMSFMDEVGVVAVLHCGMPATWCMAVGVVLGDRVRRHKVIIIIGQFREYGC